VVWVCSTSSEDAGAKRGWVGYPNIRAGSRTTLSGRRLLTGRFDPEPGAFSRRKYTEFHRPPDEGRVKTGNHMIGLGETRPALIDGSAASTKARQRHSRTVIPSRHHH